MRSREALDESRIAGSGLVDAAEDAAGVFADGEIDVAVQQLLFPHLRSARRVRHGEDVVGAIDEQHFGDRVRRQQRSERLHHFLLAVDAVEVAEPGIARAELRPRLLEDEETIRRLDAQHDVGDAAAQRLDLRRPVADPAALAQVIGGIIGG